MLLHPITISLPNKKAVRTVDFSPCGKQFVIGQAGDGHGAANLTLWDTETGQLAVEIERQPQDTIVQARFSPDGRFLVYVDSNYVIRLYNRVTGEKQALHIPDGNVNWLVFAATQNRLVAAGALT